MDREVGLGSKDPEFKSCLVVELKPGGVDSAYHPSEVAKRSASLLVYCVGVATPPGLYPVAKETTKQQGLQKILFDQSCVTYIFWDR